MQNKSAYKILEEYALIVEYYSGVITIDDIFHVKRAVLGSLKYNKTYNVIHDYRDAVFNIKYSETQRIESFLNSRSCIVAKRKGAFLTCTPNEVAFTILFSFIIKQFPIKVKTFETIQGALSWMEMTRINPYKIQEVISELKTKSENLFAI